MNKREFTVAELIEVLQTMPAEAKVQLEDADTNWTIHKFAVFHDSTENVVWFSPSDYGEMTQ